MLIRLVNPAASIDKDQIEYLPIGYQNKNMKDNYDLEFF